MTAIYYSNQVEKLYERLRAALLADGTGPFTKRVVVVPSLAMKRYLQLRLARDEHAGIGFGIKFLFIQNVFSELLKQKFYEDPLSIAFHIEKEMGPDFKFSKEVAKLFIDYGRTAPHMLKNWEGWQKDLWEKIYENKKYPYQFSLKDFQEEDMQVHLFSLSFIPHLYTSFFLELAKQVPVYFHILSPTQHYWGDIRSEKESIYLDKFWKQKGVKDEERKALLEYLKDTNPLLASLGKVGRKFLSTLEEESLQSLDDYVEPPCETTLQLLQNDFLNMANEPKKESDKSIQLHAVSSRLREVEVLYQTLTTLLNDDKEILAQDVVVMAPCIADYAPFIKAVFGQTDSLFDYQIMDLKLSAQNLFAKGFDILLRLVSGRWDTFTMKQLFDHPSFRNKHLLTQEHIEAIETWIDTSTIKWGHDKEHKARVFQRLYGETLLQTSSLNTWEEGIHQLLTHFSEEGGSMTHVEYLSQWFYLLRSLKEDLKPLELDQKMSLKEWASYLKLLLEAYFDNDPEMEDEWQKLLSGIERFSRVDLDDPFPFSSLLPHLKEMLNEESVIYNENKLSLVRFCSLLPMRAIPAKVIALMGMDEDSFPRKSFPSPLDMRVGRKDVDYVPTLGDFDRYLFLESFLSARNYFILSYCRQNEGIECGPSPIIKELSTYLNLSCQEHTKEGFLENALYSKKAFDLANIHLNVKKEPFPKPISTFSIHTQVPQKDIVIDIKDLTLAITRPLQLYVNHSLGFQLKKEEEEEQEHLTLSPLLLHQIKRAYLKHPLEKVLEVLEKRGKIPEGKLGDLARMTIAQEAEKLQKGLDKVGIEKEAIFSLEFREKCKKPHLFKDSSWAYPAIHFPYHDINVKIIGKLDVTPLGTLSLRRESFKEAVKEWPKVLLLHFAEQCENNLILAREGSIKKSFVSDPAPHLKALLDHYFLCKTSPCPLIPEWVEDVMKQDAPKLQSKIKASLGDRFGSSFDPYLLWAMDPKNPPIPQDIITTFYPVCELFKEIKRGWYDAAL